MKRILVTGGSGFVGKYVIDALHRKGYDILGQWCHHKPEPKVYPHMVRWVQSDLANEEAISNLLAEFRPNGILHLAAQSSVSESWENPSTTFRVNVQGTINLITAVREHVSSARIVVIGSSEEYGISNNTFALSNDYSLISEDYPCNPQNPYGLSKYTAWKFCELFSKGFDIDLMYARPFNHIGPGQRAGFVVPDLCRQIVDIQQGVSQPFIKVGNLSAVRDFIDVRDVANAYVALLEKGQSGETYNVCSGVGVKIETLLQRLIELSGLQVDVRVDQSLLRPVDVERIVGSPLKLNTELGWKNAIPLDETLANMIEQLGGKVTLS